jgi:hypothetical protein
MLHLDPDQWDLLGKVCGALLGISALVGLAIKKVVRPMFRATWRLIGRLNRIADDLEGDERKGIKSLREEIQELGRQHRDHLTWHEGQTQVGLNGPRPGDVRPVGQP